LFSAIPRTSSRRMSWLVLYGNTACSHVMRITSSGRKAAAQKG